jgi:hypothetical protein
VVLRSERRRPLELEWHTNDGREVGDFAWPAGERVALVRAGLAAELSERFGAFEPGGVELRERRITARSKEGAPLSRALLAAASELVALDVTAAAPYDAGRSTVRELQPPCAGCGRLRFSWEPGIARDILVARPGPIGLRVLDGAAWVELGTWDDRLATIPRIPHDRTEGQGLFFEERELGGSGLFTVPDDAEAVLCTDAVRDHLRARGSTNVAFRCVGETFVTEE